MPRIELWERLGAVKFVSNMNRPLEIVALESPNGDLLPIYEGNNEVPIGKYSIIILKPYATGSEPVIQRREYFNIVEFWNDDDVVFIVNERGFTGTGYMPYTADKWNEYAQKYNDKLVRPAGWNYGTATRMIADVKKRL